LKSCFFSAKKKYGDQQKAAEGGRRRQKAAEGGRRRQKAADVRTEWRAADSIILKKLKGI